MTDHLLTLPDGRRVCVAEYGDPSGFPVVNAHGGLACRLDVAAADDAARECSVRLLSPDRPGVGLSDPKPGRTVLDWADDVAELTALLGVDEFSVTGWSMGGAYAAAVGYALRPRLRRVAIVAGGIPLDDPSVFRQLPLVDRTYGRLSQRAPWVARLGFRTMAAAAGIAPELYGRMAARDLGPADAAVIRSEGYAAFAHMSHEALRQPAGVVDEYLAWMQPWGFRPEEIEVPVDVWGGTDDELLDPQWPSALARRIPRSTLKMTNGGHFLAHLHYPEIFSALRNV
jgi:pimeloyl-ACP methyl ester carboxylesterase